MANTDLEAPLTEDHEDNVEELSEEELEDVAGGWTGEGDNGGG